MYASNLPNSAKRNYTITEREALTMVYALHKFKHYLLGKKFVYMAFVYLDNKPQISSKKVRWLLFFWNMTWKLFINLLFHKCNIWLRKRSHLCYKMEYCIDLDNIIGFVVSYNQNMCQLYYKSCIVELEEDIFPWTLMWGRFLMPITSGHHKHRCSFVKCVTYANE
jgi:hypothetical protein